jgi:hypothetical protein
MGALSPHSQAVGLKAGSTLGPAAEDNPVNALAASGHTRGVLVSHPCTLRRCREKHMGARITSPRSQGGLAMARRAPRHVLVRQARQLACRAAANKTSSCMSHCDVSTPSRQIRTSALVHAHPTIIAFCPALSARCATDRARPRTRPPLVPRRKLVLAAAFRGQCHSQWNRNQAEWPI